MPQSLGPIPLATEIVDKTGAITSYFRLRWEELRTSFTTTPSIAALSIAARTSAVATSAAYTVLATATYRITVSTLKTIADGVNSSLTVTVGFTSGGVPCTHTFAALTTDTLGANDSVTWTFSADAASDVTYAIAYSSNTPAKMQYVGTVTVELLA